MGHVKICVDGHSHTLHPKQKCDTHAFPSRSKLIGGANSGHRFSLASGLKQLRLELLDLHLSSLELRPEPPEDILRASCCVDDVMHFTSQILVLRL